MKLIILKPTTQSKRQYLGILNKICKIPVFKKKLNISKKLLRKINFIKKNNTVGIIYSIEYNSKKNSNIAAVFDLKLKIFFYIIAPKNLKIGNIIKIGKEAENKIGHCKLLNKIPIGCPIYNISTNFKNIGIVSRAAGTFSILLNRSEKTVNILFSSGKKKPISKDLFGFIGIVSNEFFFFKQLGKAGRSRWLNIAPTVRGVAMNPIDHKNGGGEGKKSKKNNFWGK